MNMQSNRRRFLGASAASGALVGLGDLGFLSRLAPVSAVEAALDPKVVRLEPEIEPLVRLLEETSRDRLLEEVASRIKKGLSYRDLVAALLLAGVRNVQPRPSVGHKFHAVLVVNSAHLASLASPDSDRWLPIFWALDYFKDSQARDVREGNWTMAPADESSMPPARRAQGGLYYRDGPLGRGRGRRGDREVRSHRRSQRNLRDLLPLRCARLSLDRPQGDLRGQQLENASVHRLAACRAGLALAGLRTVGSRRPRQSRRARPCGRPALEAQHRSRRQDQGRLDGGAPERGRLG